jgi:hypothetical protein
MSKEVWKELWLLQKAMLKWEEGYMDEKRPLVANHQIKARLPDN